MITLEHVSKSYRTVDGNRRVILDGVTARIPHGHNFGVLGGNGAGKSTLIRLLAGVESADSGRITRAGQVSFPLGFGGTFHPHLSGRENVRFLARVYGADVEGTLDFVERFAELGEYMRMPVETYSSGMRAKLAFGSCLALDFDTYLIDEVTAVGDARFRARCKAAFDARVERSDIIMVSHDYSTLREYCDSGAVLMDGRLALFEDMEEAIELHGRRMREGAHPPMEGTR